MDKLEKDLTRLTLIVQKMMESQQANGASNELVMITADVVEPCAVFKIAAIAYPVNRKTIPLTCELDMYSFKITSMPLDLITEPNAPPAPVIKRIVPASFNASEIHAGHSLF